MYRRISFCLVDRNTRKNEVRSFLYTAKIILGRKIGSKCFAVCEPKTRILTQPSEGALQTMEEERNPRGSVVDNSLAGNGEQNNNPTNRSSSSFETSLSSSSSQTGGSRKQERKRKPSPHTTTIGSPSQNGATTTEKTTNEETDQFTEIITKEMIEETSYYFKPGRYVPE